MVENRIIRLKDPSYKSFHTIKSVIFADDDVVMLGSDDFGIYGWKVPEVLPSQQFEGIVLNVLDLDSKFVEIVALGIEIFNTVPQATAVLRGHRSIVNHVRYNQKLKVLASCGIEKIVKVVQLSLLFKSRLKND